MCLAFPLALHSEEAQVKDEADKVQELNKKLIELQAKYDILDIQSKIASKQNEIKKNTSSSAAYEQSSNLGSAFYKSILGNKGSLVANIVFTTGEDFDVKEGDCLPNGMCVKKIQNGAVYVSQGKKVFQLPKTTQSFTQQTSVGTPMPGMSGNNFIPPSM